MMSRRESIDRKIIDLQRVLATSDDQLTIALLKMAIESFASERDSLLLVDGQQAPRKTESTDRADSPA